MVSVIIDDVDAVYLSLILETPVRAREGGKSGSSRLVGNMQKLCESDGSQGVCDVVLAMDFEGKDTCRFPLQIGRASCRERV